MVRHEYFFHRRPDDDAAAIAAFRRLHMYAVEKGDRALAALAILKAVQKLENEAERERGGEVLTPLAIPAWIRIGVWDALAQLLGNRTPRGRSELFTQSMVRLGVAYRRWAIVKKQILVQPSTAYVAATALGDGTGGGSQKSLRRGYEYIEHLLEEANAFQALDEEGRALQYIEARDLIPTQKLEVILES